MIVVRWYVQLAAIWHWYLPSCISIIYFLLADTDDGDSISVSFITLPWSPSSMTSIRLPVQCVFLPLVELRAYSRAYLCL